VFCLFLLWSKRREVYMSSRVWCSLKSWLVGSRKRRGSLPPVESGALPSPSACVCLQALSLSQFHFINPGTDIVPPSETCVHNRYHSLVLTFITRYLQHLQPSHGRHKLISQWPNNPIQIPKAPQPRPRRSTSSASRNNQWRASPSPRRKGSVQQR
jgi:hypothetical protein